MISNLIRFVTVLAISIPIIPSNTAASASDESADQIRKARMIIQQRREARDARVAEEIKRNPEFIAMRDAFRQEIQLSTDESIKQIKQMQEEALASLNLLRADMDTEFKKLTQDQKSLGNDLARLEAMDERLTQCQED